MIINVIQNDLLAVDAHRRRIAEYRNGDIVEQLSTFQEFLRLFRFWAKSPPDVRYLTCKDSTMLNSQAEGTEQNYSAIATCG